MALNLSILYRGPLSSCNYACGYCPFAKRDETDTQLAGDRQSLARFVAWIAARPTSDRFRVLFTPWGEALVRRWYRDALIEMSQLVQIEKVAIQTNLSPNMEWVTHGDREKLAFWATYHPDETTHERFLKQCATLRKLGFSHSVGVVGKREHFPAIAAMRQALPVETYLWVNAYKDVPEYYRPEEVAELKAIDPYFPTNNYRHPSLGKACHTGQTVISVDGQGDVRRCHFVPSVLGNLYDPNFEQLLKERLCPNRTCGCHIGYVHMPELGQEAIYGDRLLERIPLDYVSMSG